MKRYIFRFFPIFLILISVTACSSKNSYFAKIPYGISIGCGYDDLKRLDKDAPDLALSKNGNTQYSNHTGLDGTFLGCQAEDLSVDILYSFDLDGTLVSILETIAVKDGAIMSDSQLYSDLCDEFTKTYGEPSTSFLDQFHKWEADNFEISMMRFDNLLSIGFDLK